MIETAYILFTYAILYLLPIFSIPTISLNPDKDRLLFLITASPFLIFFFGYVFLRKKIKTWTATPFDLPLLFLFLISFFSTLIQSSNPIESFASPFGPMSLLALTVFYYTLTHLIRTGKIRAATPLIVSSCVISLVYLVQVIGIVKSPNLLPFGNPVIFPVFLLSVWGYLFIQLAYRVLGPVAISTKRHQIIALLIGIGCFIILTAGGWFSLYKTLSTTTLLLPVSAGWHILLESYKDAPRLLSGVGGGNFPSAFSESKPAWLNLTDYWNLIPVFSSSYLFTLGTESGIFSLILWIYLLINILKTKKLDQSDETLSKYIKLYLAVLFMGLLIFPASFASLFLLITLLAMFAPKKEIKLTGVKSLPLSLFKPGHIATGAFILSLFGIFTVGRSLAADLIARNLQVNQANLVQSSDKIAQAIKIDPMSDSLYLLQTQLQLGQMAMLIQNSQNQNASDSASLEQFQKIAQQALTTGRTATNLAPKNSAVWGNLATIYQSLSGRVDGVENFVVDTYNHQIRLDPNSPQPKVALGRYLMNLGRFDEAKDLFGQAIRLKPDWNNAYYQMGIITFQEKNYAASVQLLQTALNLTSKDSEEYKKLQGELEQVKKLIATPTPTPSISSAAKSNR